MENAVIMHSPDAEAIRGAASLACTDASSAAAPAPLPLPFPQH